MTLGTLFMVLGKKWPASSIYYFFRTLRIVAVKRHKNACLATAAPGSASARVAGRVGTIGTALQPASMRSDLKTSKTQLVKEYAFVKGLRLSTQDLTSDKYFQKAVRYLHVCLLADLRPPWCDFNFPLAVPGEGTLARYTRPCFLLWDAKVADIAFGKEVMSKLRQVAANVSLEIVGVLGRPLYVCTARLLGKSSQRLCMSTASMSKHIELQEARKHYLCRKCIDGTGAESRRGRGERL